MCRNIVSAYGSKFFEYDKKVGKFNSLINVILCINMVFKSNFITYTLLEENNSNIDSAKMHIHQIIESKSNTPFKKPNSKTIISDDEHDNFSVAKSVMSNGIKKRYFVQDRRKKNKGSVRRKHYPIEVKRRAISLRDEGLSFQVIAKTLNTFKSNIEKWCSMKVKNYSNCSLLKKIS